MDGLFHIAIVADAIDVAVSIKRTDHPDAGAVNVFVGTTRAETHADGRRLIRLDYEAYEALAIKQMNDLASRATERWPIARGTIIHRIGPVKVGEPSVLIAVATPHRRDAFDACQWLIDTLKAEVAIWKQEIWTDGTATWVHPDARV